MKSPILVASDGTEGSLGAVRIARALAQRQGRTVEVVSVVEPPLLYGASATYPLFLADPDLEEAQVQLRRAAVEAQLAEAPDETTGCNVEVVVGSPAPAIVCRAADCGAELIVVGLGRRAAVDRWLGTETALKVVHVSHVPVLAVNPDARALPRRAVVGVDFSEFSQDAARAVTQLLPRGGEVHLAHVTWSSPNMPGAPSELEWMETYRAGARARLDSLRADLAAREEVRCFTTILDGEPSRALVRYARMTGAELIATGSHGYGFFGRMMMGSVSTRLLRQVPCSLLVAPPRTAAIDVAAITASSVGVAAVPAAGLKR